MSLLFLVVVGFFQIKFSYTNAFCTPGEQIMQLTRINGERACRVCNCRANVDWVCVIEDNPCLWPQIETEMCKKTKLSNKKMYDKNYCFECSCSRGKLLCNLIKEGDEDKEEVCKFTTSELADNIIKDTEDYTIPPRLTTYEPEEAGVPSTQNSLENNYDEHPIEPEPPSLDDYSNGKERKTTSKTVDKPDRTTTIKPTSTKKKPTSSPDDYPIEEEHKTTPKTPSPDDYPIEEESKTTPNAPSPDDYSTEEEHKTTPEIPSPDDYPIEEESKTTPNAPSPDDYSTEEEHKTTPEIPSPDYSIEEESKTTPKAPSPDDYSTEEERTTTTKTVDKPDRTTTKKPKSTKSTTKTSTTKKLQPEDVGLDDDYDFYHEHNHHCHYGDYYH